MLSLDDESEFKYGLIEQIKFYCNNNHSDGCTDCKPLYKSVNEIGNNNLIDLFAISLTDDNDNNYLWKNYADFDRGACIGFELASESSTVAQEVMYGEINADSQIPEALQLYHDDYSEEQTRAMFFDMSRYAMFIKDQKFKNEREYRIAIGQQCRHFYRIKNGIPVRYIEINISPASFGLLKITKILLGKDVDDAIIQQIKSVLKMHGYVVGDIEVNKRRTK